MKTTANTTRQITDAQLVDYVLNLLPAQDHQHLQTRIEQDSELQQRLNIWQNALFDFYADTEEKTPPKQVWQAIEHRLFNDEADEQKAPQKSRFWHYLAPALLTFCMLFAVTFYWQHRPTYQADVIADTTPAMLWKIEGNHRSINFISISDVSVAQMDCVAWLQHQGSQPVRLGVIPDTGKKKARRIELPKSLAATTGDRVIIAMEPRGSNAPLPTKEKQHIVQLTDI